MDKIVKTGLKIDLHIHSAASAHKDGVKVKNNTLENIGILIEKLNDNEVNLCSITDHDTFSYEMYQGLKAAEPMDNSIQKVAVACTYRLQEKGTIITGQSERRL